MKKIIVFVLLLTLTTATVSAMERIYYLSEEGTGATNIWSMKQDGLSKEQLTFDSMNKNYLAVSQTKNELAYTVQSVGSENDAKLYLLNLDTKITNQLTYSGEHRKPAFSSDGNQIVYWTFRPYGSGARLFIINTDGTNDQEIPGAGVYARSDPDWSVNNKIVYMKAKHMVSTPYAGMYIINTDGSQDTLVRLTSDHPGTNPRTPRFSPDGTRIAYVEKLKNGGEYYSRLNVIDIDGSNHKIIDDYHAGSQVDWSSDGKRLYYTDWDDDPGQIDIEIYSINIENPNDRIKLTDDEVNQYAPAAKYSVVINTCNNSIRNGDETDIDCGGSCPKCAGGKSCKDNSDCQSNYCNPDNICSVPSCNDGYMNSNEEGIDCGGSCPNQDCCNNNYRDANLGEGGVDCGSPCINPCPCTIPKDGMGIDVSTIFCTGNYSLINGIMINMSNVIVDCNNSNLFGNFDSGFGVGFLLGFDFDYNYYYDDNPVSNITIKNCNLYNYEHGIESWGSYNNTFTNNKFVNNSYAGIGLWCGSNDNIVKNNQFYINEGLWYGFGIILNFECYGWNNNNTIFNNSFYGFPAYPSECWTLCDHSAYDGYSDINANTYCVNEIGNYYYNGTSGPSCFLCEENWNCTEWSECSDGLQDRTCIDLNDCNTKRYKPHEEQECSICDNEIKDGNEDGIDCGGYCPVQDCCMNNHQDENEDAKDCGGPCETCPVETYTVTEVANMDSYVDSGRPSSNFGSGHVLGIGKDGASQLIMLLNFPIEQIPDDAKVKQARIRLYCFDRSDDYSTTTFKLKETTDTWYESGVNWNNKPNLLGELASKMVEPRDCNSSRRYITWQSSKLTELVQQQIIHQTSSFGISGYNKGYLILASKDSSSSKPRLIVKYSTVASCSNNKKDSGEEGIDCGGNCPPCDVVDRIKPEVEITSPQRPEDPPLYVSGTVDITATASDNVGVTKVIFLLYKDSTYNNPIMLCKDTTSPYACSWDTTAHENGKYVISAVAYDSVYNSNYYRLGLRVDNTPCQNNDGDGYPDEECGGSDCNDNDDSIHPNAVEVCGDGIDQDCDGYDEECDHCKDGRKDYAETDVDCGGNCNPCIDGNNCLVHSDCESNYCDPNNKCSTPTCNDGWQNQGEEDIDCGGPCSECISCYDGRKTGDEIGVDCGGSCGGRSDCCYNGYRDIDLGEEGVDCGGECAYDKDQDGYIAGQCGGDDCDDTNEYVYPSSWGNFEIKRAFCDCNPYTGPSGRWGYGHGPTHGTIEILGDGKDNDCDDIIDEPTFSQEFSHLTVNPQDVVYGKLQEEDSYGFMVLDKDLSNGNSKDVHVETFAVNGYKSFGEAIVQDIGNENSIDKIERGTRTQFLISGGNSLFNLFECSYSLGNLLPCGQPIEFDNNIKDIKPTLFSSYFQETGLLVLDDKCVLQGRFTGGKDDFSEIKCSVSHFNGIGFYNNMNFMSDDRVFVADDFRKDIRMFTLEGREYEPYPADADISQFQNPKLIEIDKGRLHAWVDYIAGEIIYVASNDEVRAFNKEGALLATLSGYLDIEDGKYVFKEFEDIKKIYLQRDLSILGGEQQFFTIVDNGNNKVINYQITGVEPSDPCFLPSDITPLTACIPFVGWALHLGFTLCEASQELDDADAAGLVAASMFTTAIDTLGSKYLDAGEIFTCGTVVATGIFSPERFNRGQLKKTSRHLKRKIGSKSQEFCADKSKTDCLQTLTNEYINFMNQHSTLDPGENQDLVLSIIIPESDIVYSVKSYDHSNVLADTFDMFGHNITIFWRNISKNYFIDIRGTDDGSFGLNIIQQSEIEIIHIYYKDIGVQKNASAILNLSDEPENILIDQDNDGQVDEIVLPTSVTFYPVDDSDSDGISDSKDNCISKQNPDQIDSDNDSIGDECDLCILDALNDIDSDSICGNIDDCPMLFNPSQNDSDSDGMGDPCDPDKDNDIFNSSIDCDDFNASINPNATELCNGIDDNCNGEIDEGCYFDLIIESPESEIYYDRKVPLVIKTSEQATYYYSLDKERYRRVCKDCYEYSKDMSLRYGPHILDVKAKYADGQETEKSLWFSVLRPNYVEGGTTYWAGIPVPGSLIRASASIKIITTKNRMKNREEFISTVIKVSVKNLPGIEEDEEFAIWLYSSKSGKFLKLGSLNMGRKKPVSDDPFRTGIHGSYHSNQRFIINLLGEYDGAFIEIEPSNYDLDYPIGNVILYFNNMPIGCINQCSSDENGCMNRTMRWYCEQQEDDCYYRLYETCDDNKICRDGECVLAAEEEVIFRTNAEDGEYVKGTWISVDKNNDGELQGYTYKGASSAVNCDRGTEIVKTPEGFTVRDYGSADKVFVCVPEEKDFTHRFYEEFGGAETSGNPVESYSSNGQEVYAD